jgi:hypothetical protein
VDRRKWIWAIIDIMDGRESLYSKNQILEELRGWKQTPELLKVAQWIKDK